MERLTKRDTDGQAMMDCQKCEADWTGKHGKPMVDCTALYCRNRLLDRLVGYEDTGLTPEEIAKLQGDLIQRNAELLEARQNLSEMRYRVEYMDRDLKEACQKITNLKSRCVDMKNELCQYCGKYNQAHEGACDGCKWREM